MSLLYPNFIESLPLSGIGLTMNGSSKPNWFPLARISRLLYPPALVTFGSLKNKFVSDCSFVGAMVGISGVDAPCVTSNSDFIL